MFTWWQWLIMIVAAVLVGVSKTGVAGLGILAVALFATVLPARESVGTVLLTLIAGDVVAVASFRRRASWPHLLRLMPWTAVGVVAGALALGRINDLALRRTIGGLLLALIALAVLRRVRPSATDGVALSHRQPAVIATGVLAGFTTMIANAAGPILVMYLLAQGLPKLLFMGTTAWFFLAINLFKVPFGVSLGLISSTSLRICLPLLPFAIAGALHGRRIVDRIDQRQFEQLALVLAAVAAIRLVL